MRQLASLLGVLLLCSVFSASAQQVYTFGVVPQQAASKMVKLWGPLLKRLSTDSGVTLRFVTAPNISVFEQRLVAGKYDFAYMNPYHYVVAHQKPGYEAMAKVKDKSITGVIVVNAESGIQSMEQLAGKDVAFPSPGAFAASLLPQAYFKQHNIPINIHYVKSHDSVYQNVALNLLDAGGGVMRTLKNASPSFSKKLRVLWTSQPYTPHDFASHPRIDKATRERLARAMSELHNSESGRKLLAQLNMKALENAQDSQWDDIRSLNISLLDHLLTP